MPGRALARAVALAAALPLLLGGCVQQGLAFRVDKRVTVTSPKARSEVTLPVTVRWTVRDFDVVDPGTPGAGGGKAGYFGVFVDETPQPPGKPLSWIARKDRTCRPLDGCPDVQYLAAHHVYSTSRTQITFEQLPRPSNTNQKERHNVTIVLLDTSGRRIGESAFFVDFTVKRKSLL
ncbi:MAG: hypothetical protein QOE84_403 [Actinomycetota bacterium]|nr:hypothetical protein [Actinomycetota bacterium]